MVRVPRLGRSKGASRRYRAYGYGGEERRQGARGSPLGAAVVGRDHRRRRWRFGLWSLDGDDGDASHGRQHRGSKSAVVDFVYHMFNSVVIAALFGLIPG